MNKVPELGDAPTAADCPRWSSAADVTSFSWHNLGKVRTLVRSAGLRAGLAPRAVDDLLISVSEIAINAVRYAGGAGSVSVRRVAAGLLTEIRDNGPGLPGAEVSGDLPPGIPADGGLRRAQMLCDRLDVFSSSGGVTVRIFSPCRAVT